MPDIFVYMFDLTPVPRTPISDKSPDVNLKATAYAADPSWCGVSGLAESQGAVLAALGSNMGDVVTRGVWVTGREKQRVTRWKDEAGER